MHEIHGAKNVVKDIDDLVHTEFDRLRHFAKQLSEVCVSALHDNEQVSKLKSVENARVFLVDNDIMDLYGVVGTHLSQVAHYLDFCDQLPSFVGGLKDIFEELYRHH